MRKRVEPAEVLESRASSKVRDGVTQPVINNSSCGRTGDLAATAGCNHGHLALLPPPKALSSAPVTGHGRPAERACRPAHTGPEQSPQCLPLSAKAPPFRIFLHPSAPSPEVAPSPLIPSIPPIPEQERPIHPTTWARGTVAESRSTPLPGWFEML